MMNIRFYELLLAGIFLTNSIHLFAEGREDVQDPIQEAKAINEQLARNKTVGETEYVFDFRGAYFNINSVTEETRNYANEASQQCKTKQGFHVVVLISQPYLTVGTETEEELRQKHLAHFKKVLENVKEDSVLVVGFFSAAFADINENVSEKINFNYAKSQGADFDVTRLQNLDFSGNINTMVRTVIDAVIGGNTSQELELIELSFSGEGYIDNLVSIDRASLFDDDDKDFYKGPAESMNYLFTAPHWRVGDYSRTYPLAFLKNTSMQVSGKIKASEALMNNNIEIRALQGETTLIEAFSISITEEQVTLPVQTIDYTLPDYLTYIEDFNIKWQYRIEEQSWQELTNTEHNIYVLLKIQQLENDGAINEELEEGVPTGVISTIAPIYEQALLFIFDNLNPEEMITNQDQFFDRMWQLFDFYGYPESFPQYQGKQLSYYGDPNTDISGLQRLCQQGDGQCTAWAKLFTQVLRTQGFKAETYEVISTTPNERLLVKKWFFEPENTPATYNELAYSHINIGTEEYGDFVPDEQGHYDHIFVSMEVKEEEGVAGQNNPNPIANFDNHYLVILEEKTGFYDPSYGLFYQDLLDFQRTSIAGFYQKDEEPFAKNNQDQETYKYYIRKPDDNKLELKRNSNE